MIVLKGELTNAEALGGPEPVPEMPSLPAWAPVAIPVACVAMGLILGAMTDLFVSATQGMAWEFGLALGLAVYLVWRARPLWFRLPRQAAEKPVTLPWRLVMTARTLGYDFGAASFRVDWSAVMALVPAGETWVFQSASGPVRAPRRLMTEPGAEQDFLRRSIAYLTEAARAASPDAVRRAA